MKHSIDELIALSQRFYPKQIDPDDPRYKDTEEQRRLFAAQEQAAAQIDRFRDILARLGARFPACSIEDRLYAIPTLTNAWDACYPGKLILPTIPKEDGEHGLALLVSIVAPYYMIHRVRFFYDKEQVGGYIRRGDRDETMDRSTEHFAFSQEEQPYARAIADEIEATYGYESMPPEIGNQLVPDASRHRWQNETTIYDCLFTDQIW